MPKSFLIANWKMNLPTEGIIEFMRLLDVAELNDSVETIIAPPFPFLTDVGRALSDGIKLAAQNCSEQPSGALTGEVSAGMLRQVGAQYVIVGHSERRQFQGETDEMVGRKANLALEAGLTPVLCIGEDEQTRRQGKTFPLLKGQISHALDCVRATGDLVIAYEPIWAIGTGQSATGTVVEEAHAMIRQSLHDRGEERKTDVIYGGSVSPENSDELAELDEVDGFLVGGASLEASKLLAIHASLMRSLTLSR